MNSQWPRPFTLSISSVASAVMLSLIARIDFGEKTRCSGARYLPCSGGSRLIGTGSGMCGMPGGSFAFIAASSARGMNSLEKPSVSRDALKLAEWLISIQCPPLRGVQNTGGAFLTRSRTRLCGSAT